MNKVTIGVLLVFALSLAPLGAQGDGGSALESENIGQESQRLDQEIADFAQRMEEVVQRYNLFDAEDVEILPYRMHFWHEGDYIEFRRHNYIRSDRNGEIVGLHTKTLKVYGAGDTINRLESIISERNYQNGTINSITMIDPNPKNPDTSDVTFKQERNGQVIVEGKTLGDVRNTSAFPVGNRIKRDFYIPHLSYFYYALRSIGDTYYKGRLDDDVMISDFLIRSTEY